MYSTQTDLEQRIGVKRLAELTNDTPNQPTPDSTIVTAMIERADNYINAVLGGLYAVPFNPVPGIIKNLSIDLAICACFQRRFTEMGQSELWKEECANAKKLLNEIADGLIDIGVEQESASGEVVANPKQIDFYDCNGQERF